MGVNKIKIKIDSSEKYLKIPITLDSDVVGQTDLINTNFVDIGVEKSINEVVDYDKISYRPEMNGNLIERVDYELKFIDETNISHYSDIGFNDEDIKYKRNNFKKSFLNLMFFDSDIMTSQNLVSVTTLYNRLSRFDLVNSNSPILGGTPKQANKIPIRYIIENPNKMGNKFSEGYHIYHYNELPNSLFMRANYNNAKTGISTDLVTSNDVENVSSVIGKLHTKYDLKMSNETYYYELDTNYSNNISVNGNKMTINLHEINVI